MVCGCGSPCYMSIGHVRIETAYSFSLCLILQMDKTSNLFLLFDKSVHAFSLQFIEQNRELFLHPQWGTLFHLTMNTVREKQDFYIHHYVLNFYPLFVSGTIRTFHLLRRFCLVLCYFLLVCFMYLLNVLYVSMNLFQLSLLFIHCRCINGYSHVKFGTWWVGTQLNILRNSW